MKINISMSLAFLLGFCFSLGSFGCSKAKPKAAVDDSPIQKVRDDLANGDYEACLKESKDITSQVPTNTFTEEALYLHAYAMAFGRSDFQAAKASLKQLLDLYPSGKFSLDAQKLLADCQYWLGHYQTAGQEYKKLETIYSGKGLESYALFQMGNCFLLDDKVDDALASYRELTEKYPTDPLADSAQLIIADSYLKLQNYKQAKVELQKLVSFTRDKDIQEAVQKTLRQIEEEEPFQKGVGVPE
jgi:outer membrane protein assembly factor BamD (BamD/ComL family)